MFSFGLSAPGSGCGRTTTHVPHFGHVTHEQTMRGAIEKLYGQPACFRCLRARLDRQSASSVTDAKRNCCASFPHNCGRPTTQDGLECFPEVATTMTDPAFAIKNEVQQLVDVQIDTLRKPALLTSTELDEYRSRSERITMLYRKLDLIVRKRFSFQSQTAA